MTTTTELRREVGAHMEFRVHDQTAFVLGAAVSNGLAQLDETLDIRLDGEPVPHSPLADDHGTRLQLFGVGEGLLSIDYSTTVTGRILALPAEPLDAVRYTRPSRYCEADTLTGFARETFGGLAGAELAFAVTDWVHSRLSYEPGASVQTDGAVQTLDHGRGVCRDFAHVVIALLRALDMPARLAAVYAPGLVPMDFHAVVEAMIDSSWYVFDATRLAPRETLVRISTGRDAADTAFLTNTLADIDLVSLTVRADADPLPVEDPAALVQLG